MGLKPVILKDRLPWNSGGGEERVAHFHWSVLFGGFIFDQLKLGEECLAYAKTLPR